MPTQYKEREYKAEFDLGQAIYKRIDEILKTLDVCATLIRPPESEISMIPKYASALKTLYNIVRPILTKDIRDEADKHFKNLQSQIYNFVNKLNPNKKLTVDVALFDRLEHTHMFLLEILQYTGMGIRLNKVEGWKEKLKRALKVG